MISKKRSKRARQRQRRLEDAQEFCTASGVGSSHGGGEVADARRQPPQLQLGVASAASLEAVPSATQEWPGDQEAALEWMKGFKAAYPPEGVQWVEAGFAAAWEAGIHSAGGLEAFFRSWRR